MSTRGDGLVELDRLHAERDTLSFADLDSIFASVRYRLYGDPLPGPDRDMADPIISRLAGDLVVLYKRGYDPRHLRYTYRNVFTHDLTLYTPLLDWLPFVRVLIEQYAFTLPRDQQQTACLKQFYRALAATGENPIAFIYTSCCAGFPSEELLPLFLPIWQPYLASLPQDFLTGLLKQSAVASHLVFFGAYAPHLLQTLPARLQRRFPGYQRLPDLLANPAGITADEKYKFAQWEARGRRMTAGFLPLGITLPKETQPALTPAVVAPWDWTPRKVTLPQATLTIDADGIRQGQRRLAWRLSETKAVCFCSLVTSTGRELEQFTAPLDTCWLNWPFKRPTLPAKATAPEQLDYLLRAWVHSPHFRWDTAKSYLDFLADTSAYPALHQQLAILHSFWENNQRYGTNPELESILRSWGTNSKWINVLQHFPDYIPNPAITAEVT